MAKILLVDDEEAITAELRPFLERGGFAVATARDGSEGLRMIQSFQPDLVVLDVIMPGLNGREVCRRLRAMGNWTPVIMLTQVGTSSERALSLEEGADDYLNKPFDPFELIARIKSVLRRARSGRRSLASARRLVFGSLTLDRTSRRAFLSGRELPLTSKSLALLEYLMLHHGEVIPRERLLDEIWGWDYPVATRAVDVRVAELRKTLGDNAEHPRYVETIVNEGYRFVGSVEADA
ncbi:MAG: response regulator transcription factor [Chloroflexota bacterium]|nr:MAG: response regulator transcription factor [Chloroflexota bacterium]